MHTSGIVLRFSRNNYGLHPGKITGKFSYMSACVFRSKLDSTTWHFCPTCSEWPRNEFVQEPHPPATGSLCGECKVKHNQGRDLIDPNSEEYWKKDKAA